jgi:hypothetical protein
MHIRTEETVALIDRAIIVVLGPEGHSIYVRHAVTGEPLFLSGGFSAAEAERRCGVLRRLLASVLTVANQEKAS